MTNSSIVVSLAIIVVVIVGILFFMYGRPALTGVPTEGAISITGTVACLPHANSTGPQTLECAYGLYDQPHGYYYAIDTSSSHANISQFPTGTRVRVLGTFKPEQGTVYDTIGTINAMSIALEGGTQSTTTETASQSPQTTSDGVIEFTVPSQYALAIAPAQILTHSVVPPCPEGFDYCLYYNGSAYASSSFLSAGVSIKKMPSIQNESDCLNTAPAGYKDLKPTATSSTDSYAIGVFANLEDGAAGSYSKGEEYRVFTSNACYLMDARMGISQVMASSSSSTHAFTSSDQADLMSQLRNILSGITIVATQEHIVLPHTS